jgi:hypothetical protein
VERALHRSSPSLAVLPLATHGSLSQPQRPDRPLQRSRPIAPAPLKSIRGWPTWPGPYSPRWICFPPVRRQKMQPEVLFCLGCSSQASSNGPESGLIACSARLDDLPPCLWFKTLSIGLFSSPCPPCATFCFSSSLFPPFKAKQFPVSFCSLFLPSPLFLRRTDACQLFARLIRHCLYQGLLKQSTPPQWLSTMLAMAFISSRGAPVMMECVLLFRVLKTVMLTSASPNQPPCLA